MSDKPNKWYLLALMPAFLTPAMVALMRVHRSDVVAAWPLWRAMIEQFTLFAAGVCLLAAIMAGVLTWRRERKRHA
ncbi:hypothetical protein [Sphingomonas sp.]|uniref:hypothetical protein n=1 Tax=Sphingomonas sp. TaxID=28214 RepID=UPI002E32BAC2|nr:hypothetical protein [Sphingomonas sp.]HEX4694052.1 hypothetical protein [Sphingomonas sp.]